MLTNYIIYLVKGLCRAVSDIAPNDLCFCFALMVITV